MIDPSTFPEFDPKTDDRYSYADHRAVFPDAAELIKEVEEQYGVPDDGYRVAKVPEHPVYILYGVDEKTHTVAIVCIRTFEGPQN